jgi:ribonucleoside-triphosphate reductase
MVAQIRKRDDRVEAFDVSKITRAIFRAASSVGGVDIAMASNIAQHVKDKIDLQFEGTVPSVEQVQDVVEHTLVHEGHAKTAKAYILYRDRRSRARNSRSHLMQTMRDLTFKSRGAIDLKRENANIDGECTMGVMLRYGSEASKEMSLSELISPEFADAHVNGDIHIHDLDFYPLCWNCCQIPAGKLLEAGFNTGHGNLRTASNIQSASSLACIIIQSNQNDMFGGQSIPKFDYDLAPFVAKTFVKKLVDVMRVKYDDMLSLQELEQIKSACWAHYKSQGTLVDPSTWKGNSDAWELEVDTTTLLGTLCVIIGAHTRTYHSSAYLNSPREYVDTALHILNLALDRTEKETYQGMEIVVHNLNTMHSRAGAQVPFSSLNYGTDTSAEGRMVIKNILLALDAGMGDGETPIFPIHIFKVKDGINGKPGDPNYDLFKLSIRVSAKRLFPNWVFLDAPFNAQYYKPGDPDTEAATMGCRTRVVGNTFDPQREIFTGRGNLSFISLNLPRLGLKHRNDGNLEAFFEELDEKINMMFDCLLQRFEVQAKRQAKNFPFLIGQGVWIDGESLSPEDEVRDVIKHGTLSIGFIGLAECLKALLGVHHGESEQAQKLGLEIVGRMRAKADAKSKETGLNFSVIGSPAEGLSGRFIRMDRKVFGSIAGVTDRDYYTNSNHVPVYYPISAARKIDIEAPYHALENGGHITYVEVDGDPLNNLEAMEQIVEHMKTRGIGYGSINHPVDRDPVCGYTGIIGDTCPRCGRHDGEAVSEKVLKAIRKRITKDNRSEEERIESSDRIPNVIL